MNLSELYIRLNSLAIFRTLLGDPVISALNAFLASRQSGSTAEAVSKYADFVAKLYATEKRTLAG